MNPTWILADTTWNPVVWFLGTTAITAIASLTVWYIQKRAAQARELERDEKAAELKKDADYEHERATRAEQDRTDLLKRVATMESVLSDFKEKIALMDQTVKPLFEAAKLKLIEVLTHPAKEFQVPDDLLEKVRDPNGNITPQEMAKLEGLLKKRETTKHPDVTAEEKLAAAILPTVIKLAEIEKASVEPLLVLQVVSTTASPKPEEKKE